MPEEQTTEEITITITRLKAYVMSKTSATIMMDGDEIGKLKTGESVQYRTTKGAHEFQAKAVSAIPGTMTADLQDGDTIEIKMLVVGWDIKLKR